MKAIDPNKYIVFKKEDWEGFLKDVTREAGNVSDIVPDSLDDAVVIRRKDLFAPPALYAYANAITTTLEIGWHMQAFTTQETEDLRNLADYFAQQADQSQHYHSRKVPD